MFSAPLISQFAEANYEIGALGQLPQTCLADNLTASIGHDRAARKTLPSFRAEGHAGDEDRAVALGRRLRDMTSTVK